MTLRQAHAEALRRLGLPPRDITASQAIGDAVSDLATRARIDDPTVIPPDQFDDYVLALIHILTSPDLLAQARDKIKRGLPPPERN